jgi:hypothetical protein
MDKRESKNIRRGGSKSASSERVFGKRLMPPGRGSKGGSSSCKCRDSRKVGRFSFIWQSMTSFWSHQALSPNIRALPYFWTQTFFKLVGLLVFFSPELFELIESREPIDLWLPASLADWWAWQFHQGKIQTLLTMLAISNRLHRHSCLTNMGTRVKRKTSPCERRCF